MIDFGITEQPHSQHLNSSGILTSFCGPFQQGTIDLVKMIITLRKKKLHSISCYLSIIPSICFLMSCARLSDLACTKFSKHQGFENLLFFQELYTANKVKWSPSDWWNLAFFWSARACLSCWRQKRSQVYVKTIDASKEGHSNDRFSWYVPLDLLIATIIFSL